MKLAILHVGMLAVMAGCSYPIILVGPRPSEPGPPRIESWIKPDTSAEQRVQDSIDCKGNEKGDPVFSQINIQEAMQPEDKDERDARDRMYDNWERCMLNKGYLYTGQCFSSEFSRSRPACGAP